MEKLRVLGPKFETEKARFAFVERAAVGGLALCRVVSKVASSVTYAIGRVTVERGVVTDDEGREFAAAEVFVTDSTLVTVGEANEALRDAVAKAERYAAEQPAPKRTRRKKAAA